MNNLTKTIIIITAIILLAQQASAASTKIHDKWHYSGDTFILQDTPYSIFFTSSDPDKIYLQFGNYNAIIYEGDCVEESYIQTCYTESEYDMYISEYKIKLQIYSETADISLTRTIDENELYVGDETTITVTLENTGHNDATELLYQDILPDEVEIISTSNCQASANTILFNEDIDQGDTETITYEIKAKEELDQTSKASLTYFNAKEQKNKTSSTFHLIISHLLDIELEFDEDEVDTNNEFYIDDTATLTLNLTNQDDQKLTINYLLINIPNSLIVEDTHPNTISEMTTNTFQLTGELDKDSYDELTFDLKGKLSGKAYIFIEGEYEKEDIRYNIEEKIDFEIKDKGIKITTNIQDNQALESGREKKVTVYLKNNYTDMNLRYVDINFDTNLTNEQGNYFSTLNSSDNIKISEFTITAPFVESTTNYPFNIETYYETPYREQFNNLYTRTMKIQPVPPLDITQTISDTTPEPGDIITVKISLKNNRIIDLEDVFTYDNLSSLLLIPNTKSTRTINIEKGTTRDVYSYQLIVPETTETTTYYINTTATYEDNINYTYQKQSSFTVTSITTSTSEEKTLTPTIKKTVDDSTMYISELINLDYEIYNGELETIKDLVLIFPKQIYLDRIGSVKFQIPTPLGPGEKIILKGIEQIRPKYNGTLYINETILQFKDYQGNEYQVSSNTGTLRIDESYIQGPLFFITKTAEYTQGTILITLDVENRGDTSANVALKDGSKKWNFALDSNKKRKILYTIEPIYNYIELPEAQLTYTYLNKAITAYSEKAIINITLPETTTEQQTETTTTAETTTEQQTETKEAKEAKEQKKGFMGFIKFIFNKIFKR